jgi:peptide subunit release factor 1 (eRF1)
MSGNTDPFLVLVDDIGALRRQIENLQRTSLDRDEAEHLNATIAKSLDNMAQTGKRLEQRLEGQLQLATAKTNRAAIEAAQDAARGAIRNPCRDPPNGQEPLTGRRRGPQGGVALVRRVLGLADLDRGRRSAYRRAGSLLDHRQRRCQSLRPASSHLLPVRRR